MSAEVGVRGATTYSGTHSGHFQLKSVHKMSHTQRALLKRLNSPGGHPAPTAPGGLVALHVVYSCGMRSRAGVDACSTNTAGMVLQSWLTTCLPHRLTERQGWQQRRGGASSARGEGRSKEHLQRGAGAWGRQAGSKRGCLQGLGHTAGRCEERQIGGADSGQRLHPPPDAGTPQCRLMQCLA